MRVIDLEPMNFIILYIGSWLSIFERKFFPRIYGPICEGGQWRKRYKRELEELYNELNIVKSIKSCRLRWAAILCEWMKKNYLKRYCGQALEVNEHVAYRNQDGFTG
jgi:hypothetical protein